MTLRAVASRPSWGPRKQKACRLNLQAFTNLAMDNATYTQDPGQDEHHFTAVPARLGVPSSPESRQIVVLTVTLNSRFIATLQLLHHIVESCYVLRLVPHQARFYQCGRNAEWAMIVQPSLERLRPTLAHSTILQCPHEKCVADHNDSILLGDDRSEYAQCGPINLFPSQPPAIVPQDGRDTTAGSVILFAFSSFESYD